MSPDAFLAELGTVAEVLDGVTKLREFVLELAIRGRLVHQEPTDNPASDLLESYIPHIAKLISC